MISVEPKHDNPVELQPRVLFLRNSRGITDITGAETYLLNILAGLADQGCPVHLLCLDDQRKGTTAWLRAVQARGISHEVVHVPSAFSLRDFRRVSSAIHDFQPDILHAMDHRADAVAVWAGSRHKLPRVASFFGWTNWPKASLRGMVYPIIDRVIMRRLDRIIVDSKFVGEQIRSAAPTRQLAVVENGVDTARFDPDRVTGDYKQRWFGSEAVWLVGMIGRIHPNKGHADMIEAASRLIETHPQMRFVVLGDPPPGFEEYDRDLKAQIAAKGLGDHFKITNVPSAEIPRAIASFDVTAIPSYMESLSYVMLESMAMRKPVLSARVGGHGELIEHGVNGLLHASGDQEALVQLLAQLHDDPAQTGQIAEAGRKTMLARYSTDAMVAKTLAVYQEVLK